MTGNGYRVRKHHHHHHRHHLGCYRKQQLTEGLYALTTLGTHVLLNQEQKSRAIAKTTAQCALYMGALTIFGTP